MLTFGKSFIHQKPLKVFENAWDTMMVFVDNYNKIIKPFRVWSSQAHKRGLTFPLELR
eukprot:UN00608